MPDPALKIHCTGLKVKCTHLCRLTAGEVRYLTGCESRFKNHGCAEEAEEVQLEGD